MVIKPILFYGSAVWWPALEKRIHQTKFERIMRQVAIMVTGALRTTPTKALLTILNWLPPDIVAKNLAANTALRLNATKEWKRNGYGHAQILDIVNVKILLDYTIAKPCFDLGFVRQIPERSYYDNPMQPMDDVIQIYTDGSKSSERVGCGIFSNELNIQLSSRLPDNCSVIQAEIMAIKIAADQLQYHGIYGGNILILTDSKAAIRALENVYTTSVIVQECRMSLEEIARHSMVTLRWVPGHGDIYGNQRADALAKIATSRNLSVDHYDIGLPLNTGKQIIAESLLLTANKRWEKEPTCTETKKIWPIMDSKKTRFTLNLSRIHLRNLIAVITGHWPVGRHAKRLKLPYNDFCRSCNDEEEEETTEHLLCHCPAFDEIRLRYFGHRTLIDNTCLSSCELENIHSFTRATNWLHNSVDPTD